jgi:uncharacterized protein YukE
VSLTIAVQLDAIDAMADELVGLATELDSEAHLCRSTAVSLGASVSGEAGSRAGAAGSGWGDLLALVAQRTGALAGTLREAVTSYRLADAALSDRLLLHRGTAPR